MGPRLTSTVPSGPVSLPSHDSAAPGTVFVMHYCSDCSGDGGGGGGGRDGRRYLVVVMVVNTVVASSTASA